MKIEPANQRVANQLDMGQLLNVANTAEKISRVTQKIKAQVEARGFVQKVARDWWTRNLTRLSPVNLKAEIAKLFDGMRS